jgi:hypothetical protein
VSNGLRLKKDALNAYIGDEPKFRRSETMATERALLAGGCFWGMQDLIRRYPA